ncbi:MAG: PKD domain-containing protein [Armatimonadota bacterium]|nr:PKD domain-containing protein [Armatimonadota bacterium]
MDRSTSSFDARRGSLFTVHRSLFVVWFALACSLFASGAFAVRPCSINWYDEFTYGQPTRALNGNGGWTGSATTEILAWDNWCCTIVGGSGSVDASKTGLNYYGSGSVVWVHTAIVGYNDNSNTMWNIWIDDESGRNHACLSGSDNLLVGKSGGNTTAGKSLTDRAGHDIDIEINTAVHTAEFYADGVSLGQLSYPNGQSAKVDRIRFERVDSPAAAGAMLLIGELYMGEGDIVPPTTPRAPFRPLSWRPITDVTFAWPPASDACRGVADYHVQVGTSPGSVNVADAWIGNTTSYSFTGVSGATYYCRVRARDNAGNESGWSDTGSSAAMAPPPVLQVDGEPFFPIGYYTSTAPSSVEGARDYLLTQHAQGMNTALSCYSIWCCGESYMVNEVEGAALADMKVAMEVHRYAVRGDPGYPPSLIDSQVDLLKNYPNFLGWYLIDEPEVQGMTPSALQEKYDQVKTRDPNHSIWVVHYAYPPLNPPRPALTYLAAEPPPYTDALMTDTYPVSYGTAEFAGALWWVASESKAHTDMAVSYGKQAYLNVPQVQGYQDFGTRLPTYPEQRYLSYAPVVFGSRGLLFWMYEAFSTPEHQENVVGPIAREISQLIPAILSNSTAISATSDHDADTTGNGIPDVAYMFGEDDRGGFLIAVNNTTNSFPVTIELSGQIFADVYDCSSTSVPVEFENRGAPIQARDFPNAWTLTDTFTPYDINVYRLYDTDAAVSIDLGSPDMTDGITNPQPPDGDTTPINQDGINCRRNLDPSGSPADAGFYFAVSDSFAFEGGNPDLYISIDYYDTGSGTLELTYDAADLAYKSAGAVALTGSGDWKQYVWHVTDAYFGNRQSGGSDFSILGPAGSVFYLDRVRVSENDPGSPVAVASCSPRTGSAPLTVDFDGSRSYDPDGTIVSYEWDFDGDGATDAVGANVQRVYSANGTWVASLRVTDNQGLTGVRRIPIAVGAPSAVPPAPVSAFSVSVAQGRATLTWTNPSDCDLAGVTIRAATGAYPASPTDGLLVCDRPAAPGAADSYSYNLFDNVQWYYAAFAYDQIPSYSAPAFASASSCVSIWLNEDFDSYVNGDLGGQGSWTTTGSVSARVVAGLPQGRPGQGVLMDEVAAGGAAIANEISFPPRGQGYYYLSLDMAQNSAGASGAAIGYVTFFASDSSTEIAKLHIQKSRLMLQYGSGTYAIISTSVVNNTWYTVRIGFDANTRKLDVWLNDQAKGTGFAWKGTGTDFARIVISSSSAGVNPQQVYIDNLKLEPRPNTPSAVRDDGAYTPSLSKLHFSFDPVICQGQYKYAIGTTPGGVNVRNWTGCGLSTDVLASGLLLSDNQIYYVSVQAETGHGASGSIKTSNGITVAPAVSIQQAKSLSDGGPPSDTKSLRGKVVSAAFDGFFYVKETGRHYGMRVVSSASVTTGDEVDVCGVMKGSGAERFLDAAGNAVIKTTPGPEAPAPIVLASSAVGGVDLNPLAPGVVAGVGPNNVGSLVRVFGKVTQRRTTDPKYFYIDDGCGLKDGTTTGGVENVGIRVIADPASYPTDSYVSVTGIISCFDASGLRPGALATSAQTLRL